jgi:hypothetical protein
MKSMIAQMFLDFCFDHFDSVSIWTAAPREWLERVRARFLSDRHFRFIWTRERCILRGRYQGSYWNSYDCTPECIKPLKRVWRHYLDMNRHNTIIVDDTPETYRQNYGNAVPIPTFNWPDSDDDWLLCLTRWLPRLNEGNLRSMEKRYWMDEER